MNKQILALFTVVALGVGTGTIEASDLKAGQEAQPTVGERLAKDPIKGTLMRRDGEFYWIKDTDEKEVKLHVDSDTSIDKLVAGDRIKASVTESGRVTTLLRDE